MKIDLPRAVNHSWHRCTDSLILESVLNVNAKQSREFEDPINMVEVDDTIVGLIAAQLIDASLDLLWWVMMRTGNTNNKFIMNSTSMVCIISFPPSLHPLTGHSCCGLSCAEDTVLRYC